MQVPTPQKPVENHEELKVRRAKKTSKREAFINSLSDFMNSHKLFRGLTNRTRDKEYYIQRTLFLDLHEKLPEILVNDLGVRENRAQIIADKHFKFEQNTTTTVNNFSFFSTGHRPDAVLEMEDEGLRIAIEIKKGDSGGSIRSGIGQAVVYSYEFDFVIYFFVDTTPGNNIKSSATGVKENDLIESLWENYNVKLVIV